MSLASPSHPFVRLSLPTAVVLVFALFSATVRADDETEGRKRFQHGQELFLQGRYLEAAQAFESGYEVAPRNGFLINIAHSYRRAGDLVKARTYYEKLLALDPNTPQREEVHANLRSIDDALSVQSLSPPIPQKSATPPPDPNEAFRQKVASDPPSNVRTEGIAAGNEALKPSDNNGGSVFGKAWFWALLLSTAAVGGFVAITALKSGSDCNADVCATEMK